MKKIVFPLIALIFITLISCKEKKKNSLTTVEKTEEVSPSSISQEKKEIIVQLEPKSGSKSIGKLIFKEVDGVVSLEAKFQGLTAGMHAIHIHEKADCSSVDGKSAGGHWNPTFTNHGKWGNEGGYHKGDIGNFEVDESGYGKRIMETTEWCIGCEDDTKNILGKAIIVHQGTDDFTSQPSGAAGARIICGGIIL
jgi:Cu-Zn family superoxide dismutase|tara:strand:+ start:305 stop:889 length:585 start_codon:yes stop_codon:yes gene_type:complete